MTPLGTFTDYHGLLDLLRQRKAELGLSDAALENLCLMAKGQISKYLGPAQEKAPNAFLLMTVVDALGLSGTLYADPTKVAALSGAWGREGRRDDARVRPNGRVSKAMVKRVRPMVLSQAAQKAARARWDKTTPEQRKQISAYLNRLQAERRRARTD